MPARPSSLAGRHSRCLTAGGQEEVGRKEGKQLRGNYAGAGAADTSGDQSEERRPFSTWMEAGRSSRGQVTFFFLIFSESSKAGQRIILRIKSLICSFIKIKKKIEYMPQIKRSSCPISTADLLGLALVYEHLLPCFGWPSVMLFF